MFSKSNLLLDGNGINGTIGEELPIDVNIEIKYEKFLDSYEQNFPNTKLTPSLFFINFNVLVAKDSIPG